MNDWPIAVIGASGFIGGYVCQELDEREINYCTVSRRDSADFFLDLADINSFKNLDHLSKSSVILLAANTNLANCEEDSETALQINTINTIKLIDRLITKNNFVIYLSTNLVFGSNVPAHSVDTTYAADDSYAKSKVEVEKYLHSLDSNSYAIVRLSKVLSNTSGLIVNWMRQLQRGERIQPFSDHYLAPVLVKDVAHLLIELALARRSGTFQLSGSLDVSYEQLACLLAAALNVDSSELISAVSAKSKIATPVRYASLQNIWPEDFVAEVDINTVVKRLIV